MKQKLFNVLKPLVANKGLSKDEIEGLAEIYAKNLTETSTDEEINNVANGIVPIAELMQKNGNRMATSVETKYKGFVDPTKLDKYNEWLKQQSEPPKPPVPPTEPPAPMTAEQIQKLIADGIAAGIKPFQEQQEKSRLATLLGSHEKVKGVPEVFRQRYSLDKEENLETLASQIESDYAALKQDLIRSGQFQETTPPGGGGDTTDADIQELQAMVAAAKETK